MVIAYAAVAFSGFIGGVFLREIVQFTGWLIWGYRRYWLKIDGQPIDGTLVPVLPCKTGQLEASTPHHSMDPSRGEKGLAQPFARQSVCRVATPPLPFTIKSCVLSLGDNAQNGLAQTYIVGHIPYRKFTGVNACTHIFGFRLAQSLPYP